MDNCREYAELRGNKVTLEISSQPWVNVFSDVVTGNGVPSLVLHLLPVSSWPATATPHGVKKYSTAGMLLNARRELLQHAF